MKFSLRTILFVLLAIVGLGMVSPVSAVMGLSPMTAGQSDGVLVKFRAGTSDQHIRQALGDAGCNRNHAFQTSLVRGLVHAHVSPDRSLQSTLQRLRNNGFVEYAEPNYILTAAVVPNDPQFNSLWALHNSGQTGGVADADIDAPEAWDITVGSPSVIIAVVDSGVDYTHPDLTGNIWINRGEIANNGIDDDGNGYVDDVRGWDFANSDNNPMDDNDHGTHVAGIIAAAGDNNIGVVGVNWSASIMPLKFMEANGAGSSANAITAIDYAVNNGAGIINASWGGGGFSQAMFNAISAANNAGVMFVAATGNEGLNTDLNPSYPADYNLPNVLSVAATDDADILAGFSNFGAGSVDLGAPGVRIPSTVAGGGYLTFSGTSMAAPHVTGVIGLMLATNPNLSVAALRAALLDGTDSVPDLIGRTVTGGRINAFGALTGLTSPTPVAVTPATGSLVVGDSLQFGASGGASPYRWSSSNPAVATISDTGLLNALTVGSVVVTATDANGISGSSGSITVSATTSLAVSPSTATVGVGQTLEFRANGGSAPYSWSSSDPDVASINATTGVLTAVSVGSTQVRVTDNTGATASSGIITITSLMVTPANANLTQGATLLFRVSGGVAPYVWSSSNPAVAAIDDNGLLNALSAGTAMVTVTDANDAQATASVSVSVPTLTLTPATATLDVGETQQFTAAGGTPPYRWNSSNSGVASVDADGLLRALAAGTVTVTVTDSNGVSTTSDTVTVNTPAGDGITVMPDTATLTVGETLWFTVSGPFRFITWSTSDSQVATINSFGVLTARQEGVVTVTASTSGGGMGGMGGGGMGGMGGMGGGGGGGASGSSGSITITAR